MTTDPYQPRSGDGSISAEDDALLRQPTDEGVDDPDVAQVDEDPSDPDPTPRAG